MSAALALLSSLLWGGADFLGGTVSRRLPPFAVIAVSQGLALVVLVPVAVLTGELTAPPDYLPWAVAAGLVGLLALGAFYSALAIGTMGVVAPLAALGIVVPVVVGLATGESPSLAQLLGIGLAVVGVVLSTGPELRNRAAGSARSVWLGVGAAVGFGVVLVLVAEGGESSVIMTLVAMRVSTVTLLVAVFAARRQDPRVRMADVPTMALIGAGDAGANGAYAVAAQSGLVSVTAVLASLYPVVTVLLARRVHHERLKPIQAAGIGAALAGVVLLAGG